MNECVRIRKFGFETNPNAILQTKLIQIKLLCKYNISTSLSRVAV